MERLFRWSSTHPVLSILGAVLVCLALGAGVLKLRVDASLEHLLSPDDARLVELTSVRENFGSRPLLAILVRSPDLFEASVLTSLRDRDAVFAAVEGVADSSSLFRTPVPVAKNGVLTREAPLAEIPADPDELAAKREALLGNELIRGHFVNERGDAMVMLYFLPPEKAGRTDHARILARFEEILTRQPIDRLELTIVGVPMVKQQLQDHILWDLIYLTPVALLVVGAVIFLFFRSVLSVAIPLVTGALSAVATIGFMGHAGYEISVFLSTIVVLILVLGCAEDLHLLSEYLDELTRGTPKLEAIARSGRSNGTALLLASGTTILGFASLLYTEITGMRQFAISCSVGLAVNFLVTLLILPAVLALAPAPRRSHGMDPFFRGLRHRLIVLHHRHRRAMALTCLGLLALSVTGITRLETDTDYLRFFSDHSETVQAYDRFTEAFGGAAHLTVTYETGTRHGIAEPDHFAKLRRLHEFLGAECGEPLGLPDLLDEFLKVTRVASHPLGKAKPGEEVAFLLENLPRESLRPFVDYDGSRAAIRLRAKTPTSTEVLKLERRILDFAAREFGDNASVKVTGEPVLTAHLCELVTNRLVSNLAILAAVVAALIAVIVRSVRQGLIALVPNLFPIVLTFGVMGWLGIPLSTATFPVANIALGIAVDDTIHFLLRYNALRRAGQGIDLSLKGTLRAELRPIVATSVTIGCGYLVMMLSPLRANAEAGLLFAVAIFSALLADLVMTPVLLRWLARRGGDGALVESATMPK